MVHNREEGQQGAAVNRISLYRKEVHVTARWSVTVELKKLEWCPAYAIFRSGHLHEPLPVLAQVGTRVEQKAASKIRER